MRIDGKWLLCDDGVVRPVIPGEILAKNGSWEWVEFLVDTGADRTVFSAATRAKLGLQALPTRAAVGGLGGVAESVVVETQMRLTRETASPVLFRGGMQQSRKLMRSTSTYWVATLLVSSP